jgi:LysM repeat protein
MMLSRQGVWKYLILLVVLALLLVACERPLSDTGDDDQNVSVAATPADSSMAEDGSSPPEGGAETGGQETEGSGEIAPPAAPPAGTDGTSAEPTAAPAPEVTGDEEAGGGTPDTAEATAVAEVAPPEAPAEGAPSEGAAPEATEGEAAAAAGDVQPATLPATHTVAPGENLYRIGLLYGMSWVTLAQYNGLPNANYIYVGQVLRIPGGSGTGGPATPAPQPPPGFIYHTVKAGENLYRIGLAYGMSWIPIAEANGIVNPNQIYAGQVLKIPTNVPGPQPQFTHVVQPGQTLYSISLLYGVNWLVIAQANNIAPPYAIYAGQVLVIPGS